MLPEDPSSPETWLKHAKSDLLLSKIGDRNEILLNQLCFHAQQTAEKSHTFSARKHRQAYFFRRNDHSYGLSRLNSLSWRLRGNTSAGI